MFDAKLFNASVIENLWEWHTPKLFDRLKWEFKTKTTKEQGIGDNFLACSILGVEGRAGAPRWD